MGKKEEAEEALKKLGVVVETDEQILWKEVKERTEALIKLDGNNIKVNTELLKIAERKLEEISRDLDK